MIETFRARCADALEIWGRDKGQYPQSSAAWGFFGFRMRLKATVCILLDWEKPSNYDVVPVWIGPLYVGQSYDGPTADWTEVGVSYGWRAWHFSRYRNGI
jgi:hypothetical protein